MKKLYSHFTSLSLILLVGAGTAQGMETPGSQQQIGQPSNAPSLMDQCIQFIGNNAQQVNLIDNLVGMPDTLALDTLVSKENYTYNVDHTYFDQNKFELLKLVKSNTLGINTSAALVQKIKHLFRDYDNEKELDAIREMYALEERIYDLAKDGKLENSIASIILAEKVFKKGHHYKYITDNDDFFLEEDFEQQFPLTDIITFTTSYNFIDKDLQDGCKRLVTLSPCKQFLAIATDYEHRFLLHDIYIYNLNTGAKIKLTLSAEKGFRNIFPKKLVFNQDCSKLGILTIRDYIYYIDVSEVLPKNKLSSYQLRTLLYCMDQLTNKRNCSAEYYHSLNKTFKDDYIEHMLLENENSQENTLLAKFITENIINNDIYPLCIRRDLEKHVSDLNYAIKWATALDIVAKELNMTRKEIAKELSNSSATLTNDGEKIWNGFAQKFSTILNSLDPALYATTMKDDNTSGTFLLMIRDLARANLI